MTSSIRRRAIAGLAVSLWMARAVSGQTPTADQPAPQPSVRAAVELVRVDFLALAADGQLVPDLTVADVTLKIDGRPREIRSFQFVRLAAPPNPARPSSRLPAPFGTNALDDVGRTILLIFETDSIRANVVQQATSAASEFVGTLSPQDWVGVVTMPYGGVLVEPTRDHDRVRKVLPTISAQASQQATDSMKSCRTRDTLNALADHLRGLTHLEGPKTVVLVSSGMLLPRRDAPMTRAPGPCELRSEHFEDVGAAASVSRTNLYVIQPDDLVIDSAKNAFADPTAGRFRSSNEEFAGIESLAGVTHGQLLRLTPTDRTAFAKVGRESAGYYLVGFEPRAAERNGSYRRVEFDVARVGVKVRVHPKGCCRSRWNSRPARMVPRWCACPARSRQTADVQRRRATGVVPVATLAPGDYIMRGVLSLNGAPIGKVTRVLRKAQ